MGKRSTFNQMIRYGLPRRSKNQFYMDIIPILPNFAIILKNFNKIKNYMHMLKLQEIKKAEEERANLEKKAKEEKKKGREEEKKGKEFEKKGKESDKKVESCVVGVTSNEKSQKNQVENTVSILKSPKKKIIQKIAQKPLKKHKIILPKVAPLTIKQVAPPKKIPQPQPQKPQKRKRTPSKLRDKQSFTFFNSIEQYFL